MSWLFSRALVGASSGVISSDGALYAPSSATPTPQAFSLPVKTTDACPRFRSGMTCERLTADRGEAVLTWCLEDSRVRGSVPLGTAQGLTTHAPDSGQSRLASLAKYDPATSSWKTAQCSLLGGLDVFSETWPRWGTMRGGECWGHATPARRTNATASGLSERWPTPTTSDATGGLGQAASSEGGMNLRTAVRRWPTPTKHDHKDCGTSPSQAGRNSQTLPVAVGGQMNPTWVEWLMGWPLGWTDLHASATDRFRQWCASHGNG